jgi:hypothetical protein
MSPIRLTGGHATAALVVGKLCSSKRQQNALTAAIKEYGALRRTIYAARYLADGTYRRRIARQLNKGENLHSLRRELAYAGEGRCGGATTSSRPVRLLVPSAYLFQRHPGGDAISADDHAPDKTPGSVDRVHDLEFARWAPAAAGRTGREIRQR